MDPFDNHPSESPAPTPAAAPQPPRKNWWGRNWKWFVPVAVLTPCLLCGGIITLLVGSVFGMLKGSQPYTDSLTAAQAHPQVTASLGTPIEPGFGISGSINLNNNDGDADLTYDVAGPNGTATLNVAGTKTNGVWSYTTMTATLPDGTTVDLLAPPAVTSSP